MPVLAEIIPTEPDQVILVREMRELDSGYPRCINTYNISYEEDTSFVLIK